MEYFFNKTSKGIIGKLNFGEYENCIFEHCNFESQNFSNFVFINCRFLHCNLSLSTIQGTSFKTVYFENCKMIGINFSKVKTFLLEFNFKNCVVNYGIFTEIILKKTIFSQCDLKEVDFSDSDLTGSKFIDCNLDSAVFQHTILNKVDFSSAYNFDINPVNNPLKGAIFSTHNLAGLLGSFKIKIE